jgi:hypothetical protein
MSTPAIASHKAGVGEKRNEKRSGVAYHEAGHAVVAVALRRRFRKVTIVPEHDSLGHVLQRPYPKTFQPEINSDGRTERRIRDDVMCSFAGMLAQRRACGRATGYHADLHNASDMLSYLNCSPALEWKWNQLLSVQTDELLVAWWPAVEALTSALLAEKTILGPRAREIVLDANDRAHGGEAMVKARRALERSAKTRKQRKP